MPAKTTISTLRHAHTPYNAEKRYAGTLEISLSEAGILQARQASMKLDASAFDVVVTSTQKRSIETAGILAGGVERTVRSPLCNERRFGEMEGLTWDEIQVLRPPILMISVGGDLHTVNPKGGEPFEDVWNRAKKFRRFLFREFPGLSILVVSHGVFLQMFHGVLRGLSCIESLAIYPANLELKQFTFIARRLVNETAVRLSDAEPLQW